MIENTGVRGILLRIAYATGKPNKAEKVGDVEMAFAVATSENSPFVTHMGIHRELGNIIDVILSEKSMTVPFQSIFIHLREAVATY